MHKYRRQARNLAWYDQDGEPSHYNPFKNFRPSPRRSNTIRLEPRLTPIGSNSPSANVDNGTWTTDGEAQEEKAESDRPPGTVVRQIYFIFLSSWMNILLFAIPAGFALNYTSAHPISVFFVNLIAIVPSSSILGLAMDDLSLRLGSSAILVGLINSTFGNAAQLIQSILLLKNRQIDVLRVSLLGTILTNLLLLTGLCFLIGGVRYWEQRFNKELTQMVTMLLFLAVMSLVIPTASHYMSQTDDGGILSQSRGTAVIIMISYGLWLYFELNTHRKLWEVPPKPAVHHEGKRKTVEEGEPIHAVAQIGGMTSIIGGPSAGVQHPIEIPCNEEGPTLSLPCTVITMVVTTALIAFNTQFTTDSIQGLLEKSVSPTFIGLIILPIISLDSAAIKGAWRDKMDLAIGLTLGRCLQIALMVVPLAVLLAWAMGVNTMSLQFDAFSMTTLFISMVILGYVVQEGRSNWLTGALLIKIYLIIGLASWWI